MHCTLHKLHVHSLVAQLCLAEQYVNNQYQIQTIWAWSTGDLNAAHTYVWKFIYQGVYFGSAAMVYLKTVQIK